MILKNLIYILQSENYNWPRFLKFSYSKLSWWNLAKRKKIIWTPKASLIYAITILLLIISIIILIIKFSWIGIIFSAIIIIFLPIVIGIALILTKPLDFILKSIKIKKAKNVLADRKLIIIGITGSYGKTSTKEILNSILSEKYKVLKTPENINTDIGIANFILKNSENIKEYEIFIIEMGAYRIGEIAKICDMVKPDYSILTGINESHLERFGSMDNIIKGKFELSEKTKKISILNFDDENIKNNLDRFKIKNTIKKSKDEIGTIKIKDEFSGLEFYVKGKKFSTKLLAKHNITLILLCAEIAYILGMNSKEIAKGVDKIRPAPHRLEPIYNSRTNILVIDDSYNANFQGILSGLEVVKRSQGRKIVLTPGLVELGKKSEEIHNKIGEAYANNLDLVLLIKNSVTEYIINGMKKCNFFDFKIYNSTKEAHNDLINVLKVKDTIIFQNDWPDNYL